MNEILNELQKQLCFEDDGCGGILAYARVSPAMARKLLTLSGGNRPISSATVNKYKRHMEKGTWDESAPTQFITFNKNGMLTNGHHTLRALSRCGRDIKLYFLFNTNDSAYFDCGRRRSEADRFCIADGGKRESFTGYKRAIAICNVLAEIGFENLVTEEERRDYIIKKVFAFEWATKSLKLSKQRLSTAPVRSAMLIARMNKIPGPKLEHFWDVLQTGYADGADDRSVIRLRDWLREQGDSHCKDYRRRVFFTVLDTVKKWADGEYIRAINPVYEMGDWCKPEGAVAASVAG